MDGDTKLIGARPLATPVCKGAGPRGGRGRGECRGPISGLTEGRAVARWPSDGGEGGGGESSGAGSLRAWNWARRSGEEAMGGGDTGAPFYGVGGGAERPGDGGEHAVAVVRHDGGGGGRFRRGSVRALVGSVEGGAPIISGVEGGPQEVVHVCTCEAAVAASVVRPGEEDNQAGPECRRERAGRAG
jgi:hypothetical protein